MKGKQTPSYTLLKNDELNKMLNQKFGTEKLNIENEKKWKNKEIINFGQIIGKYYIDGKFIE
ncbi:hypothetical protein JVW25_28305, partial [Vibrio cholerae O1]|nr:hypothetical protein [Vibrio cholerae O1]